MPAGPPATSPSRPAPGTTAGSTALDRLLDEVGRFEPEAVVVSLGVDAAADDPNSPLEVTDDGFSAAGRRLAGLERPTVLVHEGGYVLETLAGHTLAVLAAFS